MIFNLKHLKSHLIFPFAILEMQMAKLWKFQMKVTIEPYDFLPYWKLTVTSDRHCTWARPRGHDALEFRSAQNL